MRASLEQRGGDVLRDHMPDQHREFFAQRQQIYLSLLDQAGRPWATLLEGKVGFITAPHPRILAVAALPDAEDPARASLSNGAPIGVLGIEFATRRRNRLNARDSVRRRREGVHGSGSAELRELSAVHPVPAARGCV